MANTPEDTMEGAFTFLEGGLAGIRTVYLGAEPIALIEPGQDDDNFYIKCTASQIDQEGLLVILKGLVSILENGDEN